MSENTPIPVQLPLFDPIVIKLTKGHEAIVDPADADLARFKWYACGADNNNYAKREVKGKTVSLHRIIMGRILGRELTPEEKVDHIDGDRFNNRRNNLRLATQAENCWNAKMKAQNTSRLKGVGLHNGKYQAMINIDGKRVYLGIFNTPEEAHATYAEAAKKHYGKFARLK